MKKGSRSNEELRAVFIAQKTTMPLFYDRIADHGKRDDARGPERGVWGCNPQKRPSLAIWIIEKAGSESTLKQYDGDNGKRTTR
jgi:hypothetical protein